MSLAWTETSERRFQCTQCSFDTTVERCMRMHVRTRHKGESSRAPTKPHAERAKTLACESCDRLFVTKSGLARHVKRQHPDGRRTGPVAGQTCPHCRRGFANVGWLKRHIHDIHIGDAPGEPVSVADAGADEQSALSTTIDMEIHSDWVGDDEIDKAIAELEKEEEDGYDSGGESGAVSDEHGLAEDLVFLSLMSPLRPEEEDGAEFADEYELEEDGEMAPDPVPSTSRSSAQPPLPRALPTVTSIASPGLPVVCEKTLSTEMSVSELYSGMCLHCRSTVDAWLKQQLNVMAFVCGRANHEPPPPHPIFSPNRPNQRFIH